MIVFDYSHLSKSDFWCDKHKREKILYIGGDTPWCSSCEGEKMAEGAMAIMRRELADFRASDKVAGGK